MNTSASAAPQLLAIEDDVWVFDKPSGVLSHPGGNPADRDLITWAIATLDAPATLAPLHRLDRLTSGLVLCSPNADVRRALGRDFAKRRVLKVYRALVYGLTPAAGVIDAPLHDARAGRPLTAISRYDRLTHRSIAQVQTSLVTLRPETGRKHQLRRHLNLIGHPIVGDRVWRPSKKQRLKPAPARLWLHAQRLTLPDGRMYEAPLPAMLAEGPQ